MRPALTRKPVLASLAWSSARNLLGDFCLSDWHVPLSTLGSMSCFGPDHRLHRGSLYAGSENSYFSSFICTSLRIVCGAKHVGSSSRVGRRHAQILANQALVPLRTTSPQAIWSADTNQLTAAQRQHAVFPAIHIYQAEKCSVATWHGFDRAAVRSEA